MRSAEFEQVRCLPLFRDIAETSFSALLKAAFLQRFPAQVTLQNETERPDFLHVVVEGSVELFSGYCDRETTIAILRPVTTFILAAVVGDKPLLASARTLEASRVLMIPAEAVRSIFEQDQKFARAVVHELAIGYRSVMKELKNQKLRTSGERLANWMLQTDQQSGGEGSFRLPYDKRKLASQLGMTPENLSRNLAMLTDHGVAVRGREIILRDSKKLARLAQPTPAIDDLEY